MDEARCGAATYRPMSARTGVAKTTSTSPRSTMEPRKPGFDTMIRFRHATKIARFLTCNGKSAIPNKSALAGDMDFTDSIPPGRLRVGVWSVQEVPDAKDDE